MVPLLERKKCLVGGYVCNMKPVLSTYTECTLAAWFWMVFKLSPHFHRILASALACLKDLPIMSMRESLKSPQDQVRKFYLGAHHMLSSGLWVPRKVGLSTRDTQKMLADL
jgi:hypothetical protein